MAPPAAALRPGPTRARSSTIIGTGPLTPNGTELGPPSIDPSAASFRIVSESSSAAANALNALQRGHEADGPRSGVGAGRSVPPVNGAGVGAGLGLEARPRPKLGLTLGQHGHGHSKQGSYPDPPPPTLGGMPSAPAVPTRATLDRLQRGALEQGAKDSVRLVVSTYRPIPASGSAAQPSPLPSGSTSSAVTAASALVLVSHASLPWTARAGDLIEIRHVHRPETAGHQRRVTGSTDLPDDRAGGEALRFSSKTKGRDGFVFRLGEDTQMSIGTIQIPDSVSHAFWYQNRQEVELHRIPSEKESSIEADYIELRFSQYLGRADMWRLGMSLEGMSVHVGEKLSFVGGAVRCEIVEVWRGAHKYASGMVTAKTKTIYRSRSAQVYLFIQLSQETWEFDEDGERYYEKIVHGFLPELFQRWNDQNAYHLVTVILFARIYYEPQEVQYLEKHDLTMGLITDCQGRPCKDFYRVVLDFVRRSDWSLALAEIKEFLERSEKEILLDFHLGMMSEEALRGEQRRILGRWSFAYEGNVLETINIALNPFDEHYIDRDLSRTGLSMTVVTAGTGHFAVDKNLLRLTTDRMFDHGIALDLVCLTKMPLHSVPLFSFVAYKPKQNFPSDTSSNGKSKTDSLDLLYYDAQPGPDVELADVYAIPTWVNASFYSKTHDKPFRRDRFVPRCKMYEIQMLGILDHNLTTVTVPLLDADLARDRQYVSESDRKKIRDKFDANTFGSDLTDEEGTIGSRQLSGTQNLAVPESYQSARLLVKRAQAEVADSLASSYEESGGPVEMRPRKRSGGSAMEDTPKLQPIKKAPMRGPSPAPSTLSIGRAASVGSPLPTIYPRTRSASNANADGASSSATSTPHLTPVKKLSSKSSKGSFAARFGPTWLFGGLTGRSQPSFAVAAVETVERQAVIGTGGKPASPQPHAAGHGSPPVLSLAVPGAIAGSRSSSPAMSEPPHPLPVPVPVTAKPMPINANRTRKSPEDELGRSHRSQLRLGKSPGPAEGSWFKAAALNKSRHHLAVNPCNPKVTGDLPQTSSRRWQHVRPRPSKESQHVVKWRSICVPASLPLTTDLMPTPQEIQDFYEVNSYDIACYSEQVSFLVRADAAWHNLPLAVMREMASQRLSQNFQFIVLPHHQPVDEDGRTGQTRKVLLPGDSTQDGLRVGGASEVLRDANGAIYLSWTNHIHRLAFDSAKQSVTIQRFVKKVAYSTDPVKYKCLVWPSQMRKYQEASATFRYPSGETQLGFNYLDRLIAGEEDHLTSSLRYWRTRYILIPSGKDPLSISGILPQGERFNPAEILMTGASKVLEVLSRHQWKRPGQASNKPLKLLPTTFDPSACILDEGLMRELERWTKGEDRVERGKTLEGTTLQSVADMMRQPNNGLVIRDRKWDFNVHEDSFTGDQFCDWLLSTFSDIKTSEQATEWAESLFDKGLIEHVKGTHGFVPYAHIFYRLRGAYDQASSSSRKGKAWFGGKSTASPREANERQASGDSEADKPLNKPREAGLGGKAKRRKIRMSQSVVVDLDPNKKSDRAEVAVLHADIIHNARNALHFELNWLGVTAGLLDELRNKCATQAERYGLRFVEAPVEQIKDASTKCAYRAAIPIPLALPPPIVPEDRLPLAEHGTAQVAHFFEYAILTRKFGFVLDVEATSRYPESIDVEYSYRGRTVFGYSQFCHRSGLALVQCVGGSEGFLWSDNRLFIAAPTRGRGNVAEQYPNAPVPARLTKQEEAKALREEFEAFCNDAESLQGFYDQVLEELKAEKEGLGVEEKDSTEELGQEKVEQDKSKSDLG